MKTAQKKPVKIILSRSLCKLVNGATGLTKGGGPKDTNDQKVDD